MNAYLIVKALLTSHPRWVSGEIAPRPFGYGVLVAKDPGSAAELVGGECPLTLFVPDPDCWLMRMSREALTNSGHPQFLSDLSQLRSHEDFLTYQVERIPLYMRPMPSE